MVTLSSVINELDKKHKDKEIKYNIVNKNTSSNNKLTLNYLNIQFISYNIPYNIYNNIKKLYLSNNIISDLTGIERFENLVHLSLSNNNIYNINEIDKIPKTITSLGIKGNFIEKNPNLYLYIINKFKKITEIDDFRISSNTYKTLKAGRCLKKQIVPLLNLINCLINNAKNLANTLKVNLEIESIFQVFDTSKIKENENSYFIEKLERINKLLKFLCYDVSYNDLNDLKSKYLKGNINPSVFIINKIFLCALKPLLLYKNTDEKQNLNNVLYNINKSSDLYKNINNSFDTNILLGDIIANNFNNSSQQEIAELYIDTFKEIIKKYTIKGNYTSLPAYLNYMVVNSNRNLYSFIVEVVKTDKSSIDYKDIKYFNDYELIMYICKNFDKLFIKYTNKSCSTLIKLQLIQFYLLDPPNPCITKNDYLINIEFQNNKKETISNQTNLLDSLKLKYNPLSLTIDKDNKLRSNNNKSLIHSKINYCINKDNYYNTNNYIDIDYYSKIDYFEENLNIIQNVNNVNKHNYVLNLDSIEKIADNFIYYFSGLEFPIFPLNFDYMRCLNSIVQDKIRDYLATLDLINEVKNDVENMQSLIYKDNKNWIEKMYIKKNFKNVNRNNLTNINKANNHINCLKLKKNEKLNNQSSFSNNTYNQNSVECNLNSKKLVVKDNSHNLIDLKEINKCHIDNNSYITKTLNSNKNYINVNSKRLKSPVLEKYNAAINIFNNIFNHVIYRYRYIFMHNLHNSLKNYNKNLEKLGSILKDIFNRNLILTKEKFIKNLNKMYLTLYNSNKIKKKFNKHLISKYFYKLKDFKTNNSNIKDKYYNKLKRKSFVSLIKNYYNNKFERQKISNARLYYIHKLIKNGFLLIKYNKFINFNRSSKILSKYNKNNISNSALLSKDTIYNNCINTNNSFKNSTKDKFSTADYINYDNNANNTYLNNNFNSSLSNIQVNNNPFDNNLKNNIDNTNNITSSNNQKKSSNNLDLYDNTNVENELNKLINKLKKSSINELITPIANKKPSINKSILSINNNNKYNVSLKNKNSKISNKFSSNKNFSGLPNFMKKTIKQINRESK